MSEHGFALFPTSIGPCAVAWGAAGIVGLQLPEKTAAATRARMRKRFPAAKEADPPRAIARALRDITSLLGGRRVDLSSVELDMDGVPKFHRLAYEAARKIPAGTTRSYGEIAKTVGSPAASRAVGQAMRRNPFPIVVPCHRVLAAGGRSGGFTAEGGVDTKMRMLEIEGASIGPIAGRNGKRAASIGPITRKRDEEVSAAAAAKRTGKSAVSATTSKRAKKVAVPVAHKVAGKPATPATRKSVAKPATPATRKSVAKPAAPATRQRAAKPGGLPFDAKAAVRALRAQDSALARLIDEVGPLRLELKHTSSIFAALAEAIVYQQLTGKAAATIHGRVCALFPKTRGGFTATHILGASDAELRGCGLSRAKVAALRDLAHKTADGQIPSLAKLHAMDEDAIIEVLTSVRGIGRWTAEMLLMFRLGRPDVLPVDDYGVRKGFAIAFRRKEMPTAKELARYGEKWKPWRSVASWYLWRATDRPKAKE